MATRQPAAAFAPPMESVPNLDRKNSAEMSWEEKTKSMQANCTVLEAVQPVPGHYFLVQNGWIFAVAETHEEVYKIAENNPNFVHGQDRYVAAWAWK